MNVELGPDGLLRAVDGRAFQPALVAAPTDFELAGERIAQAPRSTDLAGITLWRPVRPLRLLTSRTGVKPNGDVLGTAQITVYACGRGRLELTLLGKQGDPVELRVNGLTWARPRVAPGAAWTGAFPRRRMPTAGRCASLRS